MTVSARHGRGIATGTESVRLAPGDVLRLGLLGISTRKLRTALSALGIAIGVATMIVVTGIPASSQAELLRRLTALGTNTLRAEPLPQQDTPVLLPKNAVAMAERIGPVTGAAAVANTHASVRRSDRIDPEDGSGLAVLASGTNLLGEINGTVRSGRFLSASTENFPTVVLGYVAATRLGIDRVVPGRPAPQVYIGDTWFTVIGVLDPLPLAPDIERSVLVGWGAAADRLGFDGRPTDVYVKAREEAIEDVRAVLPATLYPQASGLVEVSRPSDALAAKRASQATFSALFLGLAGIALLVGGVGVANTMFISVLERRREIGLRRALGATRGQILIQFMTESVAVAGLGGVAGTVLGVLATLGYVTWERWPPVIAPATVAGGLLGAVLVGTLAGIHPSVRAARLTPTQALATS
jgi:putative ABC transport system permease protein